jgi:hypothetical protein
MGEDGQLHAPSDLSRGKKLPVSTELRYGGPQSHSAHFGEDIQLLTQLGIEPRFQLCAARLTRNLQTAEICTDTIFIIFNLLIRLDLHIFSTSLLPPSVIQYSLRFVQVKSAISNVWKLLSENI